MKKIVIGLMIILAGLLFWQRELVAYGIAQAKGQFNILWRARPIAEVLNDPQAPDSLKQKIQLVQEVRAFAIDSLGVNDSDSYHTLYDQQGKPVLWVVTASEPFSLTDKQWSFPIIGSFSYKGFFDHSKALALREELKQEGYDTGIRTVSAWSTLGFFNDPIMSNLLFRSEGNVANTIVHELTHATVFVKDNLKFNENLASFVGDQGARAFLQHKYGANSEAYQSYQFYRSDRKKYTAHMLRGTEQLDSLYQQLTSEDSVYKAQQKAALIQRIINQTDTLSFRSASYQKQRVKLKQETLPNNTFFKAFVRYRGQTDSLEQVFQTQFDGDIRAYVSSLKDQYGKAL